MQSLPDQEQFQNLMVDPSEIRHQSSGWESSKRIRGHKDGKFSDHKEEVHVDLVVNDVKVEGASKSVDDSADQSNCIEIVEFFLGSSQVRDPSQPIPPPSRFVRRSK
jgi:hypothetical protein